VKFNTTTIIILGIVALMFFRNKNNAQAKLNPGSGLGGPGHSL
tara:strand:- start:918 stop:1046 length:129 start_codon:yes stop_codon:yes gene_type:complete